jgi:hypothetical protein
LKSLKRDGLSTFSLKFQVAEDFLITILVHQFFAYFARVHLERWSSSDWRGKRHHAPKILLLQA